MRIDFCRRRAPIRILLVSIRLDPEVDNTVSNVYRSSPYSPAPINRIDPLNRREICVPKSEIYDAPDGRGAGAINLLLRLSRHSH